MSSSYMRLASATTAALMPAMRSNSLRPAASCAASLLYRERIRSMPQNKFTAVGRVRASVVAISSTSAVSAASVVALDR